MTHLDTLVIGAGFAGIGMGIRLKRRGTHSFAILERAGQVGGTWRDNSYPGVACDIPSHLYSYSFRPNPNWSQFYSPGGEIWEYLSTSAIEEGLLEHLRVGVDVQSMDWDEAAALWRLTTSRGVFTCRTLILACGRLSEPRIPAVPGIDDFRGEAFHSARWTPDVNLDGKRVAVVGSGASAVQLVPRLAERAAQLVVLQRSAPYVIPRDDRAYSPAERALLARDPAELSSLRTRLFWKAEEAFAQRVRDPASISAARDRARVHLESQVKHAATRAALTPSYEIGCKRVLISSEYYPTFALPHVVLEPSALAALDGDTVVTQSGARHRIDVVIFATGFHTTQQPYARAVTGRAGERLSEHWSGGMTAHASTVVSGFPNLFVINGPNAGLSHNSAIYMIETQIDYVLGALAYQAGAGNPVLAVTRAAEEAYSRLVDELSADAVWTTGGCESWYIDPRNGRQTLLWPDFAHTFRSVNGEFSPLDFEPDSLPAVAVPR